MKNETAKKSKILLNIYILISVLSIIPASGIAFNTSKLILGIPSTVLWLLICFVCLSLLSVFGYVFVFKPWSKSVDEDGDQK